MNAVRQEVRRLAAFPFATMAAAIAYYWILALIPLLLLGASALGYAVGGGGGDELAAAIRALVPRATALQVEEALRSLFRRRTVTGGLGLLSLVWIASAAFDVVSTSLTAIQGGRETRSYLGRRLVAVGLMTASGSLLVASVLIASFSTAVEATGNRVLELLPARFVLPPGSILALIPAALMVANLWLLYWAGPCDPIAGLPALLGAAVGAALWDQARRIFNWYLVNYARYDVLFGALGAFFAVLLWIYYTAVILLLGGALAHLAARARGR